jgi:ABC-type nitrate/sulfonate/bicarbonate transport system substrate-binding protein
MGMASLPVIVFGVLPVLVWLLKRGPVTLRHALLAGAVLGNLPWVPFAMRLLSMGLGREVLTGGHAWLLGAWRAVLFGSAIGMASAAVFWLLAGRQLQARDQN